MKKSYKQFWKKEVTREIDDQSKLKVLLQPLKDNMLDSEDNKLLVCLARTFLINNHACACIVLHENKKIQLASNPPGSYQNRQKTNIYNLICKLNNKEEFKKLQNKLIITAIKKDYSFTTQLNYDIIKELSLEERRFFQEFRFSISKFGENELRKNSSKILNEKGREFFTSCVKYSKFLHSIYKKKKNNFKQILLLPLLNIYDIVYVFDQIKKKTNAWEKIYNLMIKNKGIEVVIPKKDQHAEMKILEANNFNLNIFTEKSSYKTVVTKRPCLNCWIFLCSCTKDHYTRVKITEKFGCLGLAYWNWKSPKYWDINTRNQISDNYDEIIKKEIIKNTNKNKDISFFFSNCDTDSDLAKKKEITMLENAISSGEVSNLFLSWVKIFS